MIKMTPQQRLNCLMLADILENESVGHMLDSKCTVGGRVHFNMMVYGIAEPRSSKALRGAVREAYFRHDIHQCGTTACALGYAALHGFFNDQGLTQKPSSLDTPDATTQFFDHGNPASSDKVGTSYFGYEAYNKIFGPGYGGSGALPSHVAHRLRELVQTHDQEHPQ